MRVLTVTNMYPFARMPQFGIFVREQVESIRALGHQVDVLFMNGREGRLRHKAYPLGVPRLWKLLASQHYDVIHAHYVFSGVVARFQRTCPLVVTHHGIELRHPWQGPLCRLTRNWADSTIVVADWMVPELGLEKADVIPCGVDLSLFCPTDRNAARDALGLDQAKRYILFAGNTWDPVKRFPLIEAAAAEVSMDLPDVQLITVCGEPHERVPLYMSAADVLVLTSIGEGSAQVIKEAMACNLPVVAGDAGDAWDVIRGTDGCYETSADPHEMASVLKRAISPARRTDGRSHVERFGLPSIAKQVEAVYEKTIREAGKNRFVPGRRQVTL